MRVMKGILDLMMAGLLVMLILLTVPKLWGYQIYTVTSGSMEPEIRTGDVVYVEKLDDQKLSLGDVVTYSLNEGQTRITHRIVEMDEKSGLIRTKGDANQAADASWISVKNVIGIVRHSVKGLGFAAMMTASVSGKLFLLAVFLWLTAAQMVVDMMKRGVSERRWKQ